MKAKKVLAAALAAAMAFSALPGMTVKAADEITSSTVYVDQERIEATLPTTTSQKFYIDPQGLIAIGEGTSDVVTGAGVVKGKNKMYAVNNSSVPLALSVEYKLVDDASPSGVTIATGTATNGADIQAATTQSIAVFVSAVRSDRDDGTASGAACDGKVILATGNAVASGTGVDMTASTSATALSKSDVYASATGEKDTYLMTARTYKAKLKDDIATGSAEIYDASSYEYVIDTTKTDASCVELTIGGYCSTKTDWSAYANGTAKLKLEVTFKFKKMMKLATGNWYYDADAAADAESGPKVTMTAGGLITISDLTAEKNVTGYANVVAKNGATTATLAAVNSEFAGAEWSAAEGGTCTFQLKAKNWSIWNDASITVTVTLTDGSTITSAPVTLAVQ